MKQYIILLVLVLASISNVFAQKINKDKMEEDGSRVILSESYNLYTKWTSAAGFYLAYIKNSSDSEEWSFEITLNEGKLTMGRGRNLLIKTDKGDVFELENDKEIGPSDYDYNVSSSGTDYYVKPSYILSEKQIKELLDSNIIKIRIETNGGSIDRDIKPKKFTKALKEMYEAICLAKTKTNTVYDNF